MEGKEGLQLVAAVILFLKRLDEEIKENIFDNIPAIVNKVYCTFNGINLENITGRI